MKLLLGGNSLNFMDILLLKITVIGSFTLKKGLILDCFSSFCYQQEIYICSSPNMAWLPWKPVTVAGNTDLIWEYGEHSIRDDYKQNFVSTMKCYLLPYNR